MSKLDITEGDMVKIVGGIGKGNSGMVISVTLHKKYPYCLYTVKVTDRKSYTVTADRLRFI